MTSIEKLLNGDLDLYDVLEVHHAAPDIAIKRQYRKLALKYHPDKNPAPEAVDQFQLLSTIYEILSNPTTRNDYDRIRSYKNEKHVQSQALDEHTKRFKEELLRAEQNNKTHGVDIYNKVSREFETSNQNIELLREQGLKKRRVLESEKLKPKFSPVYVSYKDLVIPQIIDLRDSGTTKVVVKWKHRPELEGQFTLDVVSDIMTVFGPVTSVKSAVSEDKYKAALLEYKDAQDAAKAVGHNYKKSATLWDGTPYRKLASLLRACTPVTSGSTDIGNIKSLETFKEEDIFTDNMAINQLLAKVITEKMSNTYSTS
ncbi:hypothetical protein PSN45_002395 [Yamadazyma tenuis]|uniref:DnaJ-domain-containing protein n=1 Tax=Candida tenuis (strain ATCC 10573 / BCRC 21748 / CBS 615 / JCM 9827 / NBRC 10315 / NRRL Y-1498 / VKM Y-70) TaxID=590646 RepID=G3B0L9_CANTC|nr:DnaJ-domain-containing protein [Yamadazyma tenuis ATCC 10573]EGV65424.1 DnaJ-domain-containing protein [Yamadazyma tenuis ATCC 10573]WEJ94894.1 hypothetical protein PSN45_002395 [Yamadazyma tenuis]